MADSVERLRAATVRSVFRAGFRQAAVGIVTAENVRLSRFIPLVGNNLKPSFFGSFHNDKDGVVLSGQFDTATWSKIGTMVLLGFLVLMELLVLVGILFGKATVWWAPFPFIGMVALVVGFTKLNQWFARNDIVWLSRVIEQAVVTPAQSCPPMSPAC